MKKWVENVYEAVKIFIVFALCTVVFYYGILWLSAEYESDSRYEEPHGRAVKVVEMWDESEWSTMLERYFHVFRHGE